MLDKIKSKWFTGEELMKRWELRPFELLELVGNKEGFALTPYSQENLRPYEIFGIISIREVTDNIYTAKTGMFSHVLPIRIDDLSQLPPLSNCLFHKNEIEYFEREHPKFLAKKTTNSVDDISNQDKKKLRPNQRHKIECGKVAQKLWKEDLTITIADMIYKDELNNVLDGETYSEKTIRNWIKRFCPDRSHGRRPKKTD